MKKRYSTLWYDGYQHRSGWKTHITKDGRILCGRTLIDWYDELDSPLSLKEALALHPAHFYCKVCYQIAQKLMG